MRWGWPNTRGKVTFHCMCILRVAACSLLAFLLAGCFHAPVLQGARVLPKGVKRQDLMFAAITKSAFAWTNWPEPPADRAAPDGKSNYSLSDRYRMGMWLPAIGGAYREGLGGSILPTQANVALWSSGLIDIGAKLQFIDAGPFAMAFGANVDLNLFIALLEKARKTKYGNRYNDRSKALFAFTFPLWAGLDLAPWFEIYVVERMQFWLPATTMPPALLLQTGGLRFGETFGITFEATFAYSPALDFLVPQVAFGLFYKE